MAICGSTSRAAAQAMHQFHPVARFVNSESVTGHDLGIYAFPGMVYGVISFFQELMDAYCGIAAAQTGPQRRALEVRIRDKSLLPYCETGFTLNIASDYVYWIEF